MQSNTQPPPEADKSEAKAVAIAEIKVTALQIREKFETFQIESRKVIWMILKSNVNPTHHAMIRGWLDNVDNKTFKDVYFAFSGKFIEAIAADVRVHFTAALDKIDTSILFPVSEYANFWKIEESIYQFFAIYPGVYHFIADEFDAQDSVMSQIIASFKAHQFKIEHTNLIFVRGFFSKLAENRKMAFWKGLSLPYNLSEREHVDAWITWGAGSQFYEKLVEFNVELKVILEKLDRVVFIEAVTEASYNTSFIVQEKILRFLANNIELFHFFARQFARKDKFLYKFLDEFIQFENGYKNVRPLLEEYNKRHHSQSQKQKMDALALPPRSRVAATLPSQSTTALVTSNLQQIADQEDEKIIMIDMKAIHGESKPDAEPGIINVRSVDLDKSLYNNAYYANYSRSKPDTFLNSNKIFIESVLKDIVEMKYEEVIIMNGSQRQSYPADEFCCMMKVSEGANSFVFSESCFVSLPKLVSHINKRCDKSSLCRLDGYLLVETFALLTKGSVFPEAMLHDEFNMLHSTLLEFICVDDKSRLLILYAQMHKMASEHPDKRIHFDFYSADRGQLQVLYEILTKHVSLKPKNVLLRLITYDGYTLEYSFKIENYFQGDIDNLYDKNVRIMLDCSQVKPVPVNPDAKKAVESRQGSSNTLMPCTLSLNVASTCSLEKFERKRLITLTLPPRFVKTIGSRPIEMTSLEATSSPTNQLKR